MERTIIYLFADVYYYGNYQYRQQIKIVDNNINKSLNAYKQILGKGYSVQLGQVIYEDEKEEYGL